MKPWGRQRIHHAAVNPVGIIQANPAMALQMVGGEPRRRRRNQIVGFSGLIVLVGGVEKVGEHAGIERNEAPLEAGFSGFRPLLPRELETMEVGSHGVVCATRIERVTTVKPPAMDSGAVTGAEFTKNAKQITH